MCTPCWQSPENGDHRVGVAVEAPEERMHPGHLPCWAHPRPSLDVLSHLFQRNRSRKCGLKGVSSPHTIKPELSLVILLSSSSLIRPATLGFPKLSIYGIPALWPCQLPPALFSLSNFCHTTLSCLLGGYAKNHSQPFSFAAFPLTGWEARNSLSSFPCS